MPFWLGASIMFIYGAVVGSFLNVIICRLPTDQSIVFPPSHCPKCKTKLRFWDLIPLFSYLLLGRKCRYCGEPVSGRYFWVELLTAVTFVGLYWHHQSALNVFALELVSGSSPGVAAWLGAINFLAVVLLASALIAVVFIDLEHWIIPDEISLFVLVLGLARNGAAILMGERGVEVVQLYIPFTSAHFNVPASIPSLIACGAVFYLIAVASEWVFKKEAMGGGDIKLAAGIGANLLFVQAMASFFVAVFLGAVIGIVLLAVKKKGRGDALPFGPMMVAGVFAVLLALPQLSAGWQAWQNFVLRWMGA